jgi:hypothetical protein
MTPDAPELIRGPGQAATSRRAASQPPDVRAPASRVVRAAKALLSDMERFSSLVLRLPLRRYQLEPLRAIVDSVLNRKGLEFLLIFPRQSGKNEAVAQLLVYLLNILQRVGGNIVYGATGDGLGLGIGRLEERLDNAWNAGRWTKRVRPTRRCLGKAAVVLVSSHPMASARGQTAHWLLVLDETQDQVGSHIEAVFTPMRAANNATALYIGTVKLTTDYLWVKKLEMERETARDGIQRVWMVHPDQVTAENPAYEQFLDAQIRKHGRHHPIIASEYFLEPIDGAGGLFDARRQHLMRGSHPRVRDPETRRRGDRETRRQGNLPLTARPEAKSVLPPLPLFTSPPSTSAARTKPPPTPSPSWPTPAGTIPWPRSSASSGRRWGSMPQAPPTRRWMCSSTTAAATSRTSPGARRWCTASLPGSNRGRSPTWWSTSRAWARG